MGSPVDKRACAIAKPPRKAAGDSSRRLHRSLFFDLGVKDLLNSDGEFADTKGVIPK